MSSRTYTSRRANILKALAEKLKDIDGSGAFLTDLQNNVEPRLKFWDEVVEFPAVHLNAGAETRQYQGGGFKDRFLAITIRCYVQDEEDADILLPVSIELDNLEKAREYVKQYSFRQVANWLSNETGRYISHVGLRKRLHNERKRKNKVTMA